MPNGPILIVDDEPHNLAILDNILSIDYQIVFACNGNDAIAMSKKHNPSLIILDIQLPDMDGYATCRSLKADLQTASIPVIFVTGKDEAGDEAAGFEAGAVDYIIKPASPAVISARIRTHLSLVKAVRLERSYRDAIYMLGAAGHHNDRDTGVHIWRMADYSSALARACGWNSEACNLMRLAATTHDTGKIGIPDAVLKKPSKLDATEWVVMKTHCRLGYDILVKSEAPVFRLAAEIALRHHEKWDGTGYPDAMNGEAIPESARIVALADVFDALSMKRPYKNEWPIERVLATIQESSGSHFDPRIVDVFVSIMPEVLEIRAMWNSRDTEQWSV